MKAHLCKNFGKSKWQLVYALLDSPGLGDRRPSQLLQDRPTTAPATVSAVTERPPCCQHDIAAVAAPKRRNDRRCTARSTARAAPPPLDYAAMVSLQLDCPDCRKMCHSTSLFITSRDVSGRTLFGDVSTGTFHPWSRPSCANRYSPPSTTSPIRAWRPLSG